MERYIIDKYQLLELIEAKAILDALRCNSIDYAESNAEYLNECVEDFGCTSLEEVVEKILADLEMDKQVEKVS